MAENENINALNCDHECDSCPNFDSCEELGDENLIVLCDDEGNQSLFELLDTIEYEDESYIVLFPFDDEESEDAIILKVRMDDNDEEIYDSIEDDALVMHLFEMFKERNKDLFEE